MRINRGFEVMIPKADVKKPASQFKNLISFRLFGKQYSITLEVKGDER